jgi:hypothetical protein
MHDKNVKPASPKQSPLSQQDLEGTNGFIAADDGHLSEQDMDKVVGGTVRKAGSGTTSGGGVYLRYTFGTVFTTATR